MTADPTRGLVDTNVLILRHDIPPSALPDELAISAVSLAELSAGVHLVGGDAPDAVRERAARTDLLQRVEREFDPLAFGVDAARMFGRMSAAVVASGRTPRRRVADLMIAATASVEGLPLYTTNPGDFGGLDELLTVVPITRPVLHQLVSD